VNTLSEAKKSLKRVTFTDDQRGRSQLAWTAAESFLDILWSTVHHQPSSELTLACRAVEEAVMWHSKALSNETK
jgi:hypothetical protein